MGFVSYVKKYNGLNLLKNYIKNHILIYALFQLLLIRKDRTGLELFRECMEKKLYDKLKRNNSKIINSFPDNMVCTELSVKKIWLCWFQGFDNAPELVKKCRESIYSNCQDYEIIELTTENFEQYVSIPSYILKKWKAGIITNTHFSDILRIYLLSQNGGLWIDSTVLLTGQIPLDIKKAPLFVFQMLKPGKDGSSVFVSSWFMQSNPNHPIIELTRVLLENYWKKKNSLCDYFLLHYFFCYACEKFSDLFDEVPKYTNSTPHTLFFSLFKPFSKEKYEAICNQTSIHKLSYKNIEKVDNENTFYDVLISKK